MVCNKSILIGQKYLSKLDYLVWAITGVSYLSIINGSEDFNHHTSEIQQPADR